MRLTAHLVSTLIPVWQQRVCFFCFFFLPACFCFLHFCNDKLSSHPPAADPFEFPCQGSSSSLPNFGASLKLLPSHCIWDVKNYSNSSYPHRPPPLWLSADSMRRPVWHLMFQHKMPFHGLFSLGREHGAKLHHHCTALSNLLFYFFLHY